MADISKLSPDDGSTILNIKDSNAVHWADNNILGAKNQLHHNIKSGTVNSMVVTVGSKGEIQLTGAPTSGTSVSHILSDEEVNNLLGKKWIFTTGIPYNNQTANITLYYKINGAGHYTKDGETIDLTNSNNTYSEFKFSWWVDSGVTPNSNTCYPMLRLASDTDGTYASYAMTNRELTTSKADDVCATGSHSIQLIVSAITPSSGQPEFFIPWNNPLKKAITFDNFKIYNRTSSGWNELTQASAPTIGSSDLKENGFYCYANLNTALTANSTFTLRLSGNIVFS